MVFLGGQFVFIVLLILLQMEKIYSNYDDCYNYFYDT